MNRLRIEIEIPATGEPTVFRIQDHLKAVLESYGVRYEIAPFQTVMGVDPGSHSHSYCYTPNVEVLHEHNHVPWDYHQGVMKPLPPIPEDFIEEEEMEI